MEILSCSYGPVCKSLVIHIDGAPLIVHSCEFKSDVVHIKIKVCVGYVLIINGPRKSGNPRVVLVGVVAWKILRDIQIRWQKALQDRFHCVDRVLVHSEHHAWVHFSLPGNRVYGLQKQ